MMEYVSEALWRDRMGSFSCTDLAVKGAGVGDVFLGLVGIHWSVSVGFLGCGG